MNKLLAIIFILIISNFSYPQCHGDINGDGELNVADIVVVVDHIVFGTIIDELIADVNNDGFINVIDIVQIVYSVINGIPFIGFDYFPNGEGCDEQKDIIQSAINSAQQNNSNVFFVHETTYCIDNTIFIPSCIEINFNNSWIIRGGVPSNTFDMVVNSNAFNNPNEGNERITLKNLRIDGTANLDILNVHELNDRFSGLKFDNVINSKLNNISVTRTINGEHQHQNGGITGASGIFFTNSHNIEAYILNAYNNDYTGITIYQSSYIEIDSSLTYLNGGSGIGSKDADYCTFKRIYSWENGNTYFPATVNNIPIPPHFSNISINGEHCQINGVDSRNCTGSGLNIGHTGDDLNISDFADIKNVKSYYNELDGITIKHSDYVHMDSLDIHHNKRNNILIESKNVNNVWYDATHTRIVNAHIYGYYDPYGYAPYNDADPNVSFFENLHNEEPDFILPNTSYIPDGGGYGIKIVGGSGHVIDSTFIYDNFKGGIAISDVNSISDSIFIKSEVYINNNGRIDECDVLNNCPLTQFNDFYHEGVGIRIENSVNCILECPKIYCTEEDINGGGNIEKSQDYGIKVNPAQTHVLYANFPDVDQNGFDGNDSWDPDGFNINEIDPLWIESSREPYWCECTHPVEPFIDLNNNNAWDLGEPYTDLDYSGSYTGEPLGCPFP